MTRSGKQISSNIEVSPKSPQKSLPNAARPLGQNAAAEQALLFADVELWRARIRILSETNRLDATAAARFMECIDQICNEIADGELVVELMDLDVHTTVHRRLAELLGDVSEIVSLPMAEQVATDIRLWLRDSVVDIFSGLLQVRENLLILAERDLEVVMPAYTHMQPSGSMVLGDWWMANESRLRRDFSRLIDCYKRMNTLPCGHRESPTAAASGTDEASQDRQLLAQYLGFDSVMENSLDAVSDRDYLVEFAAAASLIGLHISQMSAELQLWSTQEFGFVRLPRNFAFKNQNAQPKRNPELLEILRSRPSVVHARLSESLNYMKGLSLSYSYELRDVTSGLFEIVQVTKFLLELTAAILPAFKFDTNRMKTLAVSDLDNASSAVDFLLEREVPSDKANKVINELLTYCRERNKALTDLTLNEWILFSPAFNEDVYNYVVAQNTGNIRPHGIDYNDGHAGSALQNAVEVVKTDRVFMNGLAAKKLLKG